MNTVCLIALRNSPGLAIYVLRHSNGGGRCETGKRESSERDLSRSGLGTACLNNFRIRVVGVQENQAHTINSYTLETSNLKFQPILWKYHFYSMATWHPYPFSSEIETSMDLAENLDLRPPYLLQYHCVIGFLGPWQPLS